MFMYEPFLNLIQKNVIRNHIQESKNLLIRTFSFGKTNFLFYFPIYFSIFSIKILNFYEKVRIRRKLKFHKWRKMDVERKYIMCCKQLL